MSEKYYVNSEKSRQNYMIPKFKNNMNPVMPSVSERFTKEELEEIITCNFGVITVICSMLDCTYKQFYKAIDKYNLRQCLFDAKQQIVGMAEEAILDCLKSKNEAIKLKSAEITLKSLGKNCGWSNDSTIINQQINITDKEKEIKNIFNIND